ncbi:DNA-directed RNA polymerase 1B, mitochondrial-like [Iris pallida]|uniref:DNA-directed RNA polymerase 1B, mitochondrial-like n=1 Tax=Iris pallida TaxID=29817 RepID=A0AAX6DGB5_IRIPA|nr:DNA-directed RNA polymerase 1B, mitochondrial-like [Iris pallida]
MTKVGIYFYRLLSCVLMELDSSARQLKGPQENNYKQSTRHLIHLATPNGGLTKEY